MCGIVGYLGPRPAVEVVLAGLRRLEYRGYDSAGVAVVSEGSLRLAKKAGKIANLDAELAGAPMPSDGVGIGHTRWATHGAPNDVNAHPHLSYDGRVAVVHNGIIENFAALRAELTGSGVRLASQTDTEVVAHLLARALEDAAPGSGPADLADAMRLVCRRLDGAFTLVAVDAQDPELVVGARRNSPLVVGVGQGESFLASDVAAFIDHTRDAVELGQDQVVELRPSGVRVTTFDGDEAEVRPFHVDWDLSAAEKAGYDWFMRKEIYEQPEAVANTLLGRYDVDGALRLDQMSIAASELKRIDKIVVIACGTASYAGLVAKYAIEHWTRIPCEVELASEFRYRDPIVGPTTLVVAISQSGETADTLMAIRHAREQRARVVAICNTNGSTIPRESDGVIYTHAGPEIGVASTKGFLTQLVACYLLGLYLAQVRGTLFGDEVERLMAELEQMPDTLRGMLENQDQVLKLASDFSDNPSVLFLGRHVGYPVALEGALKLKELAYIHAEGFAAGELKHGPIALIEDRLPVFVVVPPRGRDLLHDKVVSNIQEVRARGAFTVVLAEEDDDEVSPYADVLIGLPKVSTLLQPLLAIVPLQLFACELATLKGHDVDQPRNLAKSVTVE
ncbi:glucosamine--fructose-6-phosphate aminotransferase (isomerizing) [Friedmanniella endophytica]|uniref:Glutamine--fructose-6-phosphate aminotransferase [isomerizing] n=1 Tax=Microlunatus kandeliicorticis TaxID=1759536 RepID=A0A7W3IQ64_9ACTN|nr:glutamine--fructose-6-phosphate transaminase (isomerizing) [Microlunatus kandeliicorticis]MBA8793179.1 glucosamine--fructose-6-phosphate aminotransferase (isomerizing) [Microlunatus kandeliicorticis]